MTGDPRRSGFPGFLLGVMLLTSVAAFAEWSWFGKKTETPTLENLKVSLAVKPESRIYPSFIIANAAMEAEKLATTAAELASEPRHLGENDGLIKVSLVSPGEPSKLKLVLTSPEVMDESIFETSLSEAGKDHSLFPKILWKFEALRKVKQVRPVNIICEVVVNGQSLGRLTKTVTMQSINDCLFYYEDESGVNNPWYNYASYVNENHPQVDRLLKEALDSRIVKQFDGYQSDDPIEVWRQIFAIWSVLQKRGIRYSSIEGGPPAMEKCQSQHVRFLDESLQATQANCVDGSVLMASILRRIGIEPFLVNVPSHMFLGFYLDADRTTKRFLETTVLNVPPDEVPENLELERAFGDEYQKFSAWKTFVEAAKEGRDQYREHHENIENEDAEYGIMDIRKARLMGVLPIGFGGK